MKKRQLDHVLRAAGRITGEKQFLIVGSQSLHGKYPDLSDDILKSFEVDLIVSKRPDRTEWLNAIGIHSAFHESFGYYADPVDQKTAILPKGWKGRLVNLPPGDTEDVQGLCLDPHDLAISKYVAGREKDLIFTRELVVRGILSSERLRSLLDITPVDEQMREIVRARIDNDFATEASRSTCAGKEDDLSNSDSSGYDKIEEIKARGRENWLKLRAQRVDAPLTSRQARTQGRREDVQDLDSGQSVDDDVSG